MPVESALHKVLDDHICAEISSETIKSKQQVMDYLAWTFLYRRLHRNPSYYSLEDGSQASIDGYLSTLVSKSLEELHQSRCIEIVKNKLYPTKFGKISSYYYLSHKTIRNFSSKIKPSSDFHNILRLLAEATEYDELPVRHNEDKINHELSTLTRYKVDDWNLHLGDAHVKAFLLFQGHFSHLKMPISDYVNDSITTLDSSIRIMQVIFPISYADIRRISMSPLNLDIWQHVLVSFHYCNVSNKRSGRKKIPSWHFQVCFREMEVDMNTREKRCRNYSPFLATSWILVSPKKYRALIMLLILVCSRLGRNSSNESRCHSDTVEDDSSPCSSTESWIYRSQ